MKPIVLFISHKQQQCGVYQFGCNIGRVLKNSSHYDFAYSECGSEDELIRAVAEFKPVAVIYNYYPSTMPWLKKKTIRRINAVQIGILHEVTQEVADKADDSFFHGHIAPDPTLLLRNPIVFKTGRLVPRYDNQYPLPAIPTIGSFGFGTAGKGFEKLIATVQNEFDQAVIKLHIPFAAFGDAQGTEARAIVQRCKEIIAKPGIQIHISHDFVTQEQLLDFLAANSLNAFFYEENKGRGISSVIDYALAVQRPIAITKSNMFRHISSAYPSVCIEDSTLKTIMNNGFAPLEQHRRDWSEENLVWDYERAVKTMLGRKLQPPAPVLLDKARKLLRRGSKAVSGFWVPDTVVQDSAKPAAHLGKFVYHSLPGVTSFNRILDNAARAQYEPVIRSLFEFLPDMMARKIPEANIQQAFVLDTVYKFASQLTKPKMLSIGSYDDTAAASLKLLGFRMDEVDPVFNYDLNAFCTRPSTIKGSYELIFATSVLEHVQDDELFMRDIVDLLAPGGVAVLTVDYNDSYKPGDPIPHEDFRLYTQMDFKKRFSPVLENCSFVDTPQWDCPNPDFIYTGCKYTFATLVFRKNPR